MKNNFNNRQYGNNRITKLDIMQVVKRTQENPNRLTWEQVSPQLDRFRYDLGIQLQIDFNSNELLIDLKGSYSRKDCILTLGVKVLELQEHIDHAYDLVNELLTELSDSGLLED